MNGRTIETRLAYGTLALAAVYLPLETVASWSHGLLNPFYLVDLIAIVLLTWGAVRSLRAAPQRSPGVLCAAYGWASANGWRATAGRIGEVRSGGALDFGSLELCVVGCGTILMLGCFATSLWLVASDRDQES